MHASDFVALKNGPTVPVAPLLLLLDLEERGFTIWQDDEALVVHPREQLTADDCTAIQRWRWHLLMLLDYTPPVIA